MTSRISFAERDALVVPTRAMPRKALRILLAIDAIEAVRGVTLTLEQQVFLARLRLWANSRGTDGLRGGKTLSMAVEHDQTLESLLLARTGRTTASLDAELDFAVVAPATSADLTTDRPRRIHDDEE